MTVSFEEFSKPLSLGDYISKWVTRVPNLQAHEQERLAREEFAHDQIEMLRNSNAALRTSYLAALARQEELDQLRTALAWYVSHYGLQGPANTVWDSIRELMP